MSNEGRAYRRQVAVACLGVRGFGRQRLAVTIIAHVPDKRRRDLDNVLKAACDALQAAHIFDDDEQIDDLRITRGRVVPGGELLVRIEGNGHD
jgi:crossover junction endodeoxyribonuclease RusA